MHAGHEWRHPAGCRLNGASRALLPTYRLLGIRGHPPEHPIHFVTIWPERSFCVFATMELAIMNACISDFVLK